MTIASAINEIAVAQGGKAGQGISGAIDALNDALAGKDEKGASSISEAIALLGQNISGGGGGGTAYPITIEVGNGGSAWVEDANENEVTEAHGGDFLEVCYDYEIGYKLDSVDILALPSEKPLPLGEYLDFVMPSSEVVVSVSFVMEK